MTAATERRMSTVLITDDDPLVAHGIDRVLATAGDGFTVVAACHSGRQILAVVAERQPGIVLLDVRSDLRPSPGEHAAPPAGVAEAYGVAADKDP
jgi:DNA-binding NarL/FixJ family response regulator